MDFLNWVFLRYVSCNTQKVKIVIKKQIYMLLSLINPKNKDILWFPSFHFEPYTHRRKIANHKISKKTPQYWVMRRKLQKQLKYCSNDINLKMVHPYFSKCYLRRIKLFLFFVTFSVSYYETTMENYLENF